MAKKTTTPTTTTTPATNGTSNKAEAIRSYRAVNPDASPTAIVKALAAQGIEVTASRVSTVLGNGQTRRVKMTPAEQVRAASEFVKNYQGGVDDAEEAIKKVGAFVEKCGGSDAALEALTMYREVAAVVTG